MDRRINSHNVCVNNISFISYINNSFNAAEQFNTINMANQAISQANDQLFTLFSNNLINIAEFQAISKLIKDLEEELKRRTELEY